MAQNFDRAQYFKGLEIAVGKLEEAQRLGVQLAEQPVKRLLFVACGAPNRIMGLWEYWLRRSKPMMPLTLSMPAN